MVNEVKDIVVWGVVISRTVTINILHINQSTCILTVCSRDLNTLRISNVYRMLVKFGNQMELISLESL